MTAGMTFLFTFMIFEVTINGIVYGLIIKEKWEVLGIFYDSITLVDAFLPFFVCSALSCLGGMLGLLISEEY